MTERDVQNQILRTFGALPWCRLWRQNTGVAKFGEQVVRFGMPGQADLSGIIMLPGFIGVRLEIEVKKPGGRQTREQKVYHTVINSMGGIYVLATSVEDVWAELKRRGVPCDR